MLAGDLWINHTTILSSGPSIAERLEVGTAAHIRGVSPAVGHDDRAVLQVYQPIQCLPGQAPGEL